MKRDTILIGISVLFLGISAYILYTSFFAIPGSLTLDLTSINTVETSTQLNAKVLDKQIETSIKNLGPTGLWNDLETSSQYKSLTAEANIDVPIGSYGEKPNPFLAITYSTSTNAE